MKKNDVDGIILTFTQKIYGFALSKTREINEAEELASEIVWEVYNSLLLVEKPANMEGYIYRIASNIFAKYVIKRKKLQKNTSIENFEIPVMDKEYSPDDEKELEKLKKEIGFLSERQRTIIYMHYYEEKKVWEIAEKLGISESNVKWHLSDARTTLKEAIVMENPELELQRENLVVNPIKFCEVGQSGTASFEQGTKSFFGTRIKENIAWICYKNPCTLLDIARTIGVPTHFVADELQELVNAGFIDVVEGSKNPKYQTNMLLIDQRPDSNGKTFDSITDEIFRSGAKKIVQDYYKPIFDAFEKDSSRWNMKCENGEEDLNFLKYNLVLLCNGNLSYKDSWSEIKEFCVARPNGANYVAIAFVTDDCQNKKKGKDFFLHLQNSGNEYYSFEIDYKLTDRGYDKWNDVQYGALYKFWKSGCDKNSVSLEEYECLCKKGYIANGKLQIVTLPGKKQHPCDYAAEYLKQFDSEKNALVPFLQKIDEEVFSSIKNRFPKHIHKLLKATVSNFMGRSEAIPFIIEEMLEIGMIKELKPEQKKAVFSILSV